MPFTISLSGLQPPSDDNNKPATVLNSNNNGFEDLFADDAKNANEDSLLDFDFADLITPEAAEYKAASYNGFDRNAANGLVDQDARQGQIGDCGLMATIRALRNSEGGQHALDDVMDYDAETGTWSFTFNTKDFKGEDALPPIIVTQAEVDKAIEDKHVSKGDDDISAIELAVEKYLTILGDSTENDKINSKDGYARQIAGLQNRAREKRAQAGDTTKGYLDGVNPNIAYFFTGELPRTGGYKPDSKMYISPENALESFNKQTDMLVFSQISLNGTAKGGNGDETSNSRINIGDDQVLANHAYTVCEVQGDNVILRESNNPSETITVTRQELLNCVGNNTFYYYSYPVPEAGK